MALYREIYRDMPGHRGAAKDLADLTNSISWNLAVSGKDLARGLRLAKESVEANANAMNIDTLAVLYYLNGEREKAEETLRDAMEGATETEKNQYGTRLEEFETDNLILH